MANKIKSIAPVVIPSGGTQLSAETVVFGLDKDGGLWKWDTGQKTDTWIQVCKALKGQLTLFRFTVGALLRVDEHGQFSGQVRVMQERVLFGPIFEPPSLHGVGPRVEEPAIGLSSQLYFPPYEDMRLKKP